MNPSPSTKRRNPLRVAIGIILIGIAVWSFIINPPAGSGANVLGELAFILLALILGIRLVFTRPKE